MKSAKGRRLRNGPLHKGLRHPFWPLATKGSIPQARCNSLVGPLLETARPRLRKAQLHLNHLEILLHFVQLYLQPQVQALTRSLYSITNLLQASIHSTIVGF